MTLTFLGAEGGRSHGSQGGGDYREMTANEKGSSEYYGALWGIREYSS